MLTLPRWKSNAVLWLARRVKVSEEGFPPVVTDPLNSFWLRSTSKWTKRYSPRSDQFGVNRCSPPTPAV
jgi:hypothetical protein